MIKDLFRQPGRIAVITGGNRGIGADVVEKLLQCEINVVMGKRYTNKISLQFSTNGWMNAEINHSIIVNYNL